MKIETDEILIKKCSNGDDSAFDFLFKKYSKPITNFINGIIHDWDRSQDIFQDTFMSVFENSHKFNSLEI